MCNRKYMVVDEVKDGCGDQFVEVYDDLDAANIAAENVWAHLTDTEKKNRHIYVGWVERDDTYVSEPEEDNWFYSWHSMDWNGYCFDSEKGEKNDY